MLIGRSRELQLILKEIKKPATAGDVKRIIAVNGIFGVGKSTLLRELIAELQNSELVDAILYSNEDAHMKFLPEFVYQLINSFRGCKSDVPRYKSDETDSRWMRFYEIQQELNKLNVSVPDLAQDNRVVASRTEELQSVLRHRTADDRRLMTDTASVMCETLLVDLMNTFYPVRPGGAEASSLNASQGPRKIVIVVDTYEKMTLALNTWLLEHFLLYCYIKRFGDFRSYNSPYLSADAFVRQFFDIRFVIAGREPLRTTDTERRWDRWQQTLLELTLQQFNSENIREYITEQHIDGVVNVDEVLNATAGLPYLVSLWSHTYRGNTNQGDSQIIAAHAQERIFWYKTPEQIEWIRCAAFCDWFDADVLRCFPATHAHPQEAFTYLRRCTELSRESTVVAAKLELLPIIRDSIRKAVRQESPDVADEYTTIAQSFITARQALQRFQPDDAVVLRHLAYFRRFDLQNAVKNLWPSDVTIVEKLIATTPDIFVKAKKTYSLSDELSVVLSRYNSYDEQSEFTGIQQRAATLWSERAASLVKDHTEYAAKLRKEEEDIVRVQSEQDNAELQLRDAQTQVLDLENQIAPLRKSTPPLSTNRDAAAARIAFVVSVIIGAAAWYTTELLATFQAAEDLVESVHKILIAFTVGFALLFGFFVSRSVALRSRRRQQKKNRAELQHLEQSLSEARQRLNDSFTLVDMKQKERELSMKSQHEILDSIRHIEECLAEPFV